MEQALMEPLVDSYGRRIKNMRISITDKCNFRCTYCMPAEGVPWLKKAEILTYEEITRISRIADACTLPLELQAVLIT